MPSTSISSALDQATLSGPLDATAINTGRQALGLSLRAVRKAQKLTLKALSRQSGVALSTLSKMELGQISVSYEKLGAVANALKVDVSRLFNPPASLEPKIAPTFVHSTLPQAPSYLSDHYEFRVLGAEYPSKAMEPMHGRILARKENDFIDFIRHPGEEFIVVLSGAVRIVFETGESVLVKRTESVYFDSSIGHKYLSVGKADAQVVVVMRSKAPSGTEAGAAAERFSGEP
jgi:transcriptional regulator with XRE-family HTH domain